ncbi:MAG: LPP20 family lipoprotein [Treponema sp.]|nr:LPP20 family lipoprotein [Treponema sp.]MBR0487654.1 LPP20 family lipoprotein [Treponema sp.]
MNIIKKVKKLNSIFLFSLVLLAGCASTSGSGSIPDWMTDYRSAYPDTHYIAQRGRADSEQTAKTEAVAQIARYFQTSVNANLKTSIQSVTSGDSVSETTSVVNDVDVQSQVDLFAVEYTEPYYFNKEKKWYCVAYIERDKAWNQYQPTVENAKTEFYSMKKNADTESDPLTKCSLYGKTWNSGKVFLEKLEYARILNSQKERA